MKALFRPILLWETALPVQVFPVVDQISSVHNYFGYLIPMALCELLRGGAYFITVGCMVNQIYDLATVNVSMSKLFTPTRKQLCRHPNSCGYVSLF